MWNLKNDTNELICKNRLTVIEKKKLTFTEGEGWVRKGEISNLRVHTHAYV